MTLGQRLMKCDLVAYCDGYVTWSAFWEIYNAGFSPETCLKRLGLKVPEECNTITQEAAE